MKKLTLLFLFGLAACGKPIDPPVIGYISFEVRCSEALIYPLADGGDGLSHQVAYASHRNDTVECSSDIPVTCNIATLRAFQFATGPNHKFDNDHCKML